MIILITLFILLVGFAVAWTITDDGFYGFLSVIKGLLLIVAIITIPCERIDINTDIRRYEALKETVEESRSIDSVAHGIERASIMTMVAEKNGWLRNVQYWNKTVFDLWIPDTVDTLQPLK